MFRMGPVSAVTAAWLQGPWPSPVFFVLNLVSPLALPAAAFLATLYVYFHSRADWLATHLTDTNFTDPLHYEVYDFIVSKYRRAMSSYFQKVSQNFI